MMKFIKGLKLSEEFYNQIVKPIIKEKYPKLEYTACLIGRGSEVLGYDDNISTDHDWGPRIIIFIKEKNKSNQIKSQIEKELPFFFKGFPVSFTKCNHKWGVRLPENKNKGEINSRIDIYTIESFFKKYLYYDIKKELTSKDWLVFPQQKLLSLNKGKIFHDDLNIRLIFKKFSYYPDDIWLYMLTAQWSRIGELSALHFRTEGTGDELGSKIIANQIVKMLMEIWFIYNKKYYPYDKWFGKMFNELPSSSILKKKLESILNSKSIKNRKKYFDEVYSIIARHHNSKKLPLISTKTSDYFARPYKVIQGGQIASLLYKSLTPELKSLKIKNGNIDQLVNQIDLIDNTIKFKKIY